MSDALYYGTCDFRDDARPDVLAAVSDWADHVAETVAENFRLVGWYAAKKRDLLGRAFAGDDHEIESRLGRALTQAVEKWDPLRKIRLSTYAAGAFKFVTMRALDRNRRRRRAVAMTANVERRLGRCDAPAPIIARETLLLALSRTPTITKQEAEVVARHYYTPARGPIWVDGYKISEAGVESILGRVYTKVRGAVA